MLNISFSSVVGYEIPRFGFGVAYGFGKAEDPLELTVPGVLEALKVGYRFARPDPDFETFMRAYDWLDSDISTPLSCTETSAKSDRLYERVVSSVRMYTSVCF